jgi:hypothetical protein
MCAITARANRRDELQSQLFSSKPLAIIRDLEFQVQACGIQQELRSSTEDIFDVCGNVQLHQA